MIWRYLEWCRWMWIDEQFMIRRKSVDAWTRLRPELKIWYVLVVVLTSHAFFCWTHTLSHTQPHTYLKMLSRSFPTHMLSTRYFERIGFKKTALKQKCVHEKCLQQMMQQVVFFEVSNFAGKHSRCSLSTVLKGFASLGKLLRIGRKRIPKSMNIRSQKGLKSISGKMLQKKSKQCAQGLQNGSQNPSKLLPKRAQSKRLPRGLRGSKNDEKCRNQNMTANRPYMYRVTIILVSFESWCFQLK